MASRRKRGPVALRLQLWLELPLSGLNLRLREKGCQFWHVLSGARKHTEAAILRAAGKGRDLNRSMQRIEQSVLPVFDIAASFLVFHLIVVQQRCLGISARYPDQHRVTCMTLNSLAVHLSVPIWMIDAAIVISQIRMNTLAIRLGP